LPHLRRATTARRARQLAARKTGRVNARVHAAATRSARGAKLNQQLGQAPLERG
jgi:hypothetical protein